MGYYGKSSGVVLLVSTEDRVMYVSTSDGVQSVLTTDRLNNVMEGEMKPYMKRNLYSDALNTFVDSVEEYFKIGPPTFWETYAFLIQMMVSIIGMGLIDKLIKGY